MGALPDRLDEFMPANAHSQSDRYCKKWEDSIVHQSGKQGAAQNQYQNPTSLEGD